MEAAIGGGRQRGAAHALQYCLSNGPYDKIDSLLTLLSLENPDVFSVLIRQSTLESDGSIRIPPFFRDTDGALRPYSEYSFWTTLSLMREKPLWFHGVEAVRFSQAPPSESFQLPSVLLSCPALKSLSMENCGVSEIPSDLFRLRKLRALNLRGNRLKSLPPGIGRLRQLVYFNAAENELEFLPSQLGQLKKLMVLDLSGNRLVSTGFSFDQLIFLNTLNLAGNCLESAPEGLEFLNQLEKVDLSFNELTADEEAAWESDHYTLIKNYQWHLTF